MIPLPTAAEVRRSLSTSSDITPAHSDRRQEAVRRLQAVSPAEAVQVPRHLQRVDEGYARRRAPPAPQATRL